MSTSSVTDVESTNPNTQLSTNTVGGTNIQGGATTGSGAATGTDASGGTTGGALLPDCLCHLQTALSQHNRLFTLHCSLLAPFINACRPTAPTGGSSMNLLGIEGVVYHIWSDEQNNSI